MAYLRKERKPSGTYLRIVEAVRQGKKITQNILFNLGKVEDYTPEALQNIGKKLYRSGEPSSGGRKYRRLACP